MFIVDKKTQFDLWCQVLIEKKKRATQKSGPFPINREAQEATRVACIIYALSPPRQLASFIGAKIR